MKTLNSCIFLLIFLVVIIPCYLAGAIAWIITSCVIKGWDAFDTLGDPE